VCQIVEGSHTMLSLTGKVALVTSASRGVGRGVALGLGEAGATVYVTGRTVAEGQAAASLPGTIYQTAAEVTELGGKGITLNLHSAFFIFVKEETHVSAEQGHRAGRATGQPAHASQGLWYTR
jgi:NAD(P)-dependent dehydrogenase (short-subunit alcohol dehydrogenase family)